MFIAVGHAGVAVTLGALLATLERNDVAIEVHSRPLRQILVIEVLHSGDRWVFEAPRRRGGLGQAPAVRGWSKSSRKAISSTGRRVSDVGNGCAG